MSSAADLPTTTARPGETPKSSARRTAWVSVAVGLLFAAGLFVIRPTPEDLPNAGKTRSPVTPSPRVPEVEVAPPPAPPVTRAPTAAVANRKPPRKPEPRDDSTDRPDLGPGWLHVVVQPWGNVWIDGVWMGRAPVKARVAEGRHVVEVGRDLPSKKRVVEVRPGAKRELELQLGE